MNPFQTIWLNPKRTFDYFVTNNEDQSLFATPLILLGVSSGLDISTDLVNDIGSKWASLLAGIPLGIGLSFFIMAFVIPGMIKLFGRIWKGPATMRQLVNVCSIAYIPFCLILIHQIALLLVGEAGTSEQVNQGISYTLWLWSFGLLIIGVAKVQRFSYGMALLNILISDLPFITIALLIAK